MDEILQQIDKIFQSTENVEKEMLNDFELFKSKLDCIITGNKENNKTPQQKKKIKRLSVIIDGEENDKKSTEIILHELPDSLENNDSIRSTASQRPVRAAKLKVESMKQPTLKAKLRRPSNTDDTCSVSKNDKTIKIEQTKNDTIRTRAKDRTRNNSSSSSGKRSFENESSSKDDLPDASKKIDESLLILSNSGDIPIIELSDDESDKMMPPPLEIPKKKTNRKPKQLETSEVSTRSSRLRVKKEKLSVEKTTEKAVESVEVESNKINEIVEEVKEECTEEPFKPSSKKGKSKKAKKQFKCLPIKEESRDSGQGNEKKSNEKDECSTNKNIKTVKQTSMESVYEDAVADDVGKQSLNTVEQQPITARINPVVAIEQLRISLLSKHQASLEIAADATFISAKDGAIAEIDATFVTAACPQQTFIMNNTKQTDPNNLSNDISDTNKTQHISANMATPIDATFYVNNETFKTQPAEQLHHQQPQQEKVVRQSSIMTEEDSDDELMPPPPPTPTKSKKKELFNPCVQSPVKKKVEAFEKHASAIASPLVARQTRTKTKTKENADPEPITYVRSNTPLLKRNVGKLLTPTQQVSNITPNIGIQNTKYSASSISKLAEMIKPIKSASISKTPSLSRENSVEDVKRSGYSKLQLLAEEKKKKREQKQQQAALTREAKEKERADKLKKSMQEREEKLRRKVQDLDQKKQLEEINKNLKLQEEKREAQKRLGRKQLELEMVEAARKEREHLDNIKVQKTKEELQQMLLQNQKILEEKKSKKTEKQALKYDFNLLNSDDSTDDEGKTNSKKPPPPSWSRTLIRQMLIERQANLHTDIIDSLFSVQAMTPDLREIFPAIDPRYLKRNSSVFWNTPPRYSTLPKY